MIEAVQLAGGITDQANVREIEILRQGPGQGTQAITLDFWEMLNTGNISQDITLRHGDAVYVPTATALTPEELTQLSEEGKLFPPTPFASASWEKWASLVW